MLKRLVIFTISEKIYTPKEMDLTKRSHQKKISHQKSLQNVTRKRDLTKKLENSHQEESVKDCKAAENVDEAWLQVHFLFLREHQKADDVT